MNLANRINLDGWLRPLAAASGRLRDMTPAFQEVGEVMLNRVRSNFLASSGQRAWAELAPSTLLNRARGVSGKNVVVGYGHSKAGPISPNEHRLIEGLKKAPAWVRKMHGIDMSGPLALTKKARKAVESAKPLIWTGRLLRANYMRASSMFAEVYNPLVQAKRLFFGFKDITPSRNPYFFPDADRRQIRDIFKRWIFAPLMGG